MCPAAMAFSIHTHDAWGTIQVAEFSSLEEARTAFSELCQDPWYRQDGGVKGLELVHSREGSSERLEWFTPTSCNRR